MKGLCSCLDAIVNSSRYNNSANQKKTKRVTSIRWKGDRALSYNGSKTETNKYSFQSSAIKNGLAKKDKR